MPRNNNPDTTYGKKLTGLLARLLFSGEWISLSELSKEFSCSKQTVMRLVDDMINLHGIPMKKDMQRGQRYYRLESEGNFDSEPRNSMGQFSETDLSQMIKCRQLVQYMVGFQEFARMTASPLKEMSEVEGG